MLLTIEKRKWNIVDFQTLKVKRCFYKVPVTDYKNNFIFSGIAIETIKLMKSGKYVRISLLVL